MSPFETDENLSIEFRSTVGAEPPAEKMFGLKPNGKRLEAHGTVS